jgi:hypothetical protein
VLCADELDGMHQLSRLSHVDVRTSVPPSSLADSEYLERLNRLHLGGDDLGFEIGPAQTVQELRITVFESARTVSSAPIFDVDCTDTCASARIAVSMIGDDRRFELPRSMLEPGNIVVVSIFVQSVDELGAVSWGIELE